VFCHDYIYKRACLLQLAYKLDRFVGCNAPTDSDDDTPVK
jgi:hypothetical protein